MISVEHLVKYFGVRKAVDDVSFDVSPGTVLGFLGPNGAGKTTTIRILAGYLRPSGGRVSVHGVDVLERPVEAQRHIGYMPENTPLYEDMTVESFLRFAGRIRGFAGAELTRRVADTMERCMIESIRHQVIDTLSKGYRQRTCLAQALLHDPPVLLLDEPTEGLDPNQKQVVRDMIRTMGREKTILLSTHVLEEVEAVCSRAMIISQGAIKIDSTPAELLLRSRSRNVVTLEVEAPRDEALGAFGELAGVERVVCLGETAGRVRLKLHPQAGGSVTVAVLDEARRRSWPVIEVHTDPGRLYDVFGQITISDDVTPSVPKEAA